MFSLCLPIFFYVIFYLLIENKLLKLKRNTVILSENFLRKIYAITTALTTAP